MLGIDALSQIFISHRIVITVYVWILEHHSIKICCELIKWSRCTFRYYCESYKLSNKIEMFMHVSSNVSRDIFSREFMNFDVAKERNSKSKMTSSIKRRTDKRIQTFHSKKKKKHNPKINMFSIRVFAVIWSKTNETPIGYDHKWHKKLC